MPHKGASSKKQMKPKKTITKPPKKRKHPRKKTNSKKQMKPKKTVTKHQKKRKNGKITIITESY